VTTLDATCTPWTSTTGEFGNCTLQAETCDAKWRDAARGGVRPLFVG
jgi:hypothetical protein